MNRLCIYLTALLVVQAVFPAGATAQTKGAAQRLTVEQILGEMVESFSHKIRDNYALSARIDIKPESPPGYADMLKPSLESWHVVASAGRKVQLSREAKDKVEIIFYTTAHALRLLATGVYNPMTAILRSRQRDPVMIHWERPPGVESTPGLRDRVRIFHQTFFSSSLPHRYFLSAENARSVHGALAVGLYYYPGLRSAWYQVSKGQRVNNPGETSPYNEAFIFISGRGWAKIGDKTVPVKAGESYYVPPNSDNVVWTNSNKPLVFIWLAWGEGA